jgi:transcriptional repressor NrdR
VQCPRCRSAETKVVDSRAADQGLAIRRRRECVNCQHRFSTFERIEEVPLVVVKRSGGREPFDVDKIASGLEAAGKGRPTQFDDYRRLAGEVEEAARLAGMTEVTSEWVGLAVLERLGDLDEVVYMRFASVYKSFADADDFEREVRLIKRAPSDKTESHRRPKPV